MRDTYHLPLTSQQEAVEQYGKDVSRFLDGSLSPELFRAKRVPMGVYEQRRDGTYLVRVRLPGGRLGSAQAGLLAGIADSLGNGSVHLTTRQGAQMHDVRIEDTPEVMRLLLAGGLSSRGSGGSTVRNVTACALAGFCPAERFDVDPFARSLSGYLTTLAGSYHLPRKYKIAFSGCGADCALARFNDLGFIAAESHGRPGFAVYAGGGMGARSRIADRIEEWVPAEEILRVGEAVRRLFDRLGDRASPHRARLRFVFEKIGAAAFRTLFREETASLRREGVPECTVRTDDHGASSQGPSPPEPERDEWSGLRVFRQRQPDLAAVPLHLPLGMVSAADLNMLGDLSARYSREKGLRTDRSQNLILPSVGVGDLAALAGELGRLEHDPVEPVSLERFTACAGADECRLGLCASRGAAQACAGALEGSRISRRTVAALEVKISGCPNACGHHPAASIGLLGAARRLNGRLVPAYRVVLGGHSGEGIARLARPSGTVLARSLPDLLSELARDFDVNRVLGESFSDYHRRRGAEHFEGIVAGHDRAPHHSRMTGYYRDWGKKEDFSLAGRGSGECGAGVFEVIGADLRAARRALETLNNRGKSGTVFSAMLPAVRALLVTRGFDSPGPDEILRAFERHFVDSGLVGGGFRTLLSRGRGYAAGRRDALDGWEGEVRSLLDRVEFLHSTLDSNLNFHPPERGGESGDDGGGAAPPGEPTAVQEGALVDYDLRGLLCPVNFIKAKLRLETMGVGDRLSILLDDGESAENVPLSFLNEGQEILETSQPDPSHWRVVVRKRQ